MMFGTAQVAGMKKEKNYYVVKVMMDRVVARNVIRRNMLEINWDDDIQKLNKA